MTFKGKIDQIVKQVRDKLNKDAKDTTLGGGAIVIEVPTNEVDSIAT